uniref:TIL domain-containing protein n=1 Tax=Steinernema glaseri TaxID=37863 RepID=A0A1I7ZPH5_9BILA
MASERMIALTLFVVATALAQDTPKCRDNEQWMECGTCEGTCDNPSPICTRECKPAKCYCPAHKGFVRFGYTGKCVPATQCPTYSKPAKRSVEHKCGENEEWSDCAGCDEGCENPIRACPASCQQRCACKNGFVRGWDGKCIVKSECTAHPDCASTSCPAETKCIYQPKFCKKAPCPQVACVPIEENPVIKRQTNPLEKTCQENERWTNCGSCEEHCENPRGMKFQACTLECRLQCECLPGYVRGWDEKCIKKEECTAHPECASTTCDAGTRCVWDPKNCLVAPCPQLEPAVCGIQRIALLPLAPKCLASSQMETEPIS